MITFNIEKPDAAIAETLQEKINNLTKPKGSLGRLEELALQIGLSQQTLTPVSYTHLDGYKRQLSGQTAQPAPTETRLRQTITVFLQTANAYFPKKHVKYDLHSR